MTGVFLSLVLAPALFAQSDNPLALVKTDDPYDTMKTFMTAMDDYKRGLDQKDPKLKERISAAIDTLDLSNNDSFLGRDEGKKVAIYLKEIIDRTIIVNYSFIPRVDDPGLAARNFRWRLKDTQITIARVESGPRKGEYLFTSETVKRAEQWFQLIQDRPYKKKIPKDRMAGAGYKPPWYQNTVQSVPEWTQGKFLTLSWWQWIGMTLAVLLGLTFKVITRRVVNLMGKLAQKTSGDWDDKLINAVNNPLGILSSIGLWFISLYILRIEGQTLVVLKTVLKVFFSIVVVWLIYRLTHVLTEYLKYIASKTETTLDDQLVPLLNRTLKIMVLVVGVLAIIQNMGFNVMSVLAGLGIGGLAIAMAAKDTVANFFGSLMILFDRPFQVGDWIVVGSAEGTVEEIGFRSTRIRTFYNSVVSIPNSEVANAKIDNMGMREYRRVYTTVGLTYDTPPEKLEAFMEGVKNIIKANPHTRKDYFHVVFSGYGDSSLNIMLYFFFKVPNWNDELVERQNIYLEILRLAKELGVEFAFPTQTLHMESFPEKQSNTPPQEVIPEHLRATAKSFGANGKNARVSGQGFFTPPHREGGGRQAADGDGDG